MKHLDNIALDALVALAEDAGRLIVASDRTAEKKEDGTDVTAADIASHRLLTDGIRSLFGADAKILSEEGLADVPDLSRGYAFVIDPLDGTSNFKSGSRNYAVLLSVLKHGTPVFGVAVAPEYGVTVCGGTAAGGAEYRLHDRRKSATAPYRMVKRIEEINNGARIAIVPQRFVQSADPGDQAVIRQAMSDFQSSAGKKVTFKPSAHILGSIAPIRKKTTRYRMYEATRPNQRPGDWDLAAWDAILRGVGGIMTARNGAPLAYGQASTDFKHQGFICWRSQREAMDFAAAPEHAYRASGMARTDLRR